jgi:hypothetical protein
MRPTGTSGGGPRFSNPHGGIFMNREPQPDPTNSSPNAPEPPQKGKDVGPKLGGEQPGRGLDTGVDTGAIQPGASGDSAALD